MFSQWRNLPGRDASTAYYFIYISTQIILFAFSLDVAEENIIPIKLNKQIVRDLNDGVPLLGQYFEAIEINENGWGRMLLSPECHSSYPDDDRAGSEWVSAQE